MGFPAGVSLGWGNRDPSHSISLRLMSVQALAAGAASFGMTQMGSFPAGQRWDRLPGFGNLVSAHKNVLH
jgi:hypothetical protein